jgi:outer membrane receptor protein involved in Fe transport
MRHNLGVRIVLPFAAICLFSFGTHAQVTATLDGTVRGTVRDAQSHAGIPGVVVSFGSGKGVSTNDSGRYEILLPAGDYTVQIRFIGYAERSIPVQVKQGSATVLDAELMPSTSQLDMVVVSAGKFEQRVGEVTQSLSVLPAQLMRDKNTVTLSKVLDQVPGVVVVDDDPQIRAGSGFSYGAGSRVMLLVDGLPILSGDIGRPNWSFMPIEDVEQVEIIKGASSVLYGSAALSGVINVRTAYPGAEAVTRATMFGGVYDMPGIADGKWWGPSPPLTTGASFMHSQRFKKFDLVLGGNVFGDQGFVGPERVPPDTLAKYPNRLGDGGYNNRARFNFATRWRNQKMPGLNYGINGNVMKSRSSTVFIWDNLDTGLYRPSPGTLTNTTGTQFYVDPFVSYTGPQSTRHSLKGRLYRQDFGNSNGQSNSNNTFFEEYQFQRKFDLFGETNITAGISAQQVYSNAELYVGGPNADGLNTASNYAGYLQVDKRILEKLMLSAGVRYERFQVNEDEQAEPVFRAGATYHLFEGTYLRASYGQGFRFPTIGERYIITSLGALHIYPNPELAPETSVNMEGGIKQGFKFGGVTGYVDVVAFRQDFNRYVEFTFGQWGADRSIANFLGFGFKSINTGGARITGGELEVAGKGKLGNVELTLLMGYTHTLPVSTTPNEAYAFSHTTANTDEPVSYANTSSNTEDNVLKFRVEDLFRSDVGASWKRFSGGVSVRYNSHVRNIDQAFLVFEQLGALGDVGIAEWMATHTTGDWITDVRVGFDLTKQLKASFIVNNFSNEVYAIRPMAIEAPRNFQVQMALEL